MTWEKATILIVDDEVQNLRMLSEFLKDEFRLVVARDGEQALLRASANPQPDVILLDITMPEMDGYEVCSRLKADKFTANIPVIFMTAMIQPSDELKGLALGAVDYIGKPYSLPIVRSRVRTHVQLKLAWFEAIKTARFAAAGQLASGIAHEINTPLQYISDNLSYISKEIDGLISAIRDAHTHDSSRIDERHISKVENDITDAMVDLTNGIARIGKVVESTKDFCLPLDAAHHKTDINRIIDNVIMVGASLWAPTARLQTNLEPELPELFCHPGRISEAVHCLIQNAVQAVVPDRQGIIQITTQRQDDCVVIRVSDNGAGIPPQIGDHIFDPFFTTRDVGSGMGLGLAIAYDTVAKHNGTISASNGPENGSVFTIRLPVLGKNENDT